MEGHLWQLSLQPGKLSHHILLHEKWYPNSIEQKYPFNLMRCDVRKYNLL